MHAVNFNSPEINWEQEKEKKSRGYLVIMKEIKKFPYSASHSSRVLTTEGYREAEILLGSILRCIRVAQELHTPIHMHESQAFPHYAISWNVLPLQTSLGLFTYLVEVPRHSPSKTHKQTTTQIGDPSRTEVVRDDCLVLPAFSPRKRQEPRQRVWRR